MVVPPEIKSAPSGELNWVFGKGPIRIVYYYNNIDIKEIPEITKFLAERYGGDKIEKGERIFLDGSKEIYAGKDIAELARALDERFDTTSVISIVLEDVTQEQLKEWGYPDAKLLPIPGK